MPEPVRPIRNRRRAGQDNHPPGPTARLGASTAGIVVCKLITALASLGIAALTARQLGPGGRGVVVLLITLATFGTLLCSLGVNIGGRVLLVAPSKPVAFTEYLGLSLALAVFAFVTCVAIGLTLLPAAGVHLSALDMVLFAVLGGTFLTQRMLNEGLVAYGLTVEAAMVEAASWVALLGFAAMLTIAGRDDVRPYVVAFVVQASLHTIGAMLWLRTASTTLRPRYDRTNWERMIRTGLPGIGFGISQLLAFRVDRYIVGLVVGPAAVGVYSVAATAPEFLRLAPTALGQNLFHRLASGSASASDFRRARALCLALTVGLGAVTFLTAPFLVELVFGPRFDAAVTPLRILILAEIGMTIFSIDGAVLMGRSWVSDVAIAATIGLVLVVVLDLLLIPSYDLAGAAWASVIAYSAMGAATLTQLKRRGLHHEGGSSDQSTEPPRATAD